MWGRYIARRIGQGVIVLWAAYTISFLILYLLPGDAATLFAGGGDQEAIDPELVAQLRTRARARPPAVRAVPRRPGQGADRRLRGVDADRAPGIRSAPGIPARRRSRSPPSRSCCRSCFGIALALAASLARAQWLRNAAVVAAAAGRLDAGVLDRTAAAAGLLVPPPAASRRWATKDSKASCCPRSRSRSPRARSSRSCCRRSLRSTLAQPYVEIVRAKGASERRVQLRPRLPQRGDPGADDGRRAHRRPALRCRRDRDGVLRAWVSAASS